MTLRLAHNDGASDTTTTQHIVSTLCRRNVEKMSCRQVCSQWKSMSCRRNVALVSFWPLWSKKSKTFDFETFDFFSRITGPIRIKFGMSILCVHTNNHAKFQIFWFIFNKVMMILKSMCKFGLFVKILLIIC